jgi:DNA-nicking Smr family endonuclease
MKDYITVIQPLKIRNTTIVAGKIKPESRQKIPNSEFSSICLKESQLNPMGRKFHRHFTAQRTIDLHGLTQNKAFERLLNFFIQCQSENVKKVIVITGGNAMKKSVIRLSFQKWIRESFGNYVISCSQAKIRHGGQGAFYLVLKSVRVQKKDTRRY